MCISSCDPPFFKSPRLVRNGKQHTDNMRVLLYAAGAAAILSTGVFAAPALGSIAFVAKPALRDATLGRSTRSMGKQMKTKASLEVKEHASDAMARVDASMRAGPAANTHTTRPSNHVADDVITSDHVSVELVHTEAAATAAMTKSWTPPVGYMPMSKPASAEQEAAVFHRVVSLMHAEKQSAVGAGAKSSASSGVNSDHSAGKESISRAVARPPPGWKSNYVPSGSSFSSSIPAKDSDSDKLSLPASYYVHVANVAMEVKNWKDSTVLGDERIDKLSSAPAKKWTAPVGYMPTRQTAEVLTRDADKTAWAAPMGYVPGSKKPELIDTKEEDTADEHIVSKNLKNCEPNVPSSVEQRASKKWTPPLGYVPRSMPKTIELAVAPKIDVDSIDAKTAKANKWLQAQLLSTAQPAQIAEVSRRTDSAGYMIRSRISTASQSSSSHSMPHVDVPKGGVILGVGLHAPAAIKWTPAGYLPSAKSEQLYRDIKTTTPTEIALQSTVCDYLDHAEPERFEKQTLTQSQSQTVAMRCLEVLKRNADATRCLAAFSQVRRKASALVTTTTSAITTTTYPPTNLSPVDTKQPQAPSQNIFVHLQNKLAAMSAKHQADFTGSKKGELLMQLTLAAIAYTACMTFASGVSGVPH